MRSPLPGAAEPRSSDPGVQATPSVIPEVVILDEDVGSGAPTKDSDIPRADTSVTSGAQQTRIEMRNIKMNERRREWKQQQQQQWNDVGIIDKNKSGMMHSMSIEQWINIKYTHTHTRLHTHLLTQWLF